MEKFIQKLKILKWNFVTMVLTISAFNFIICYLNTRDITYLIISIVGHVPVQRAFNRFSISRKANIIDIDCGCALPSGSIYARLSCLRLDDMKEFYVGEDNINLD